MRLGGLLHCCPVRHRIDGLESVEQGQNVTTMVRHRIDGLEKFFERDILFFGVRHRIDGLEMLALRPTH